jgi:probable rRNA maturation factor
MSDEPPSPDLIVEDGWSDLGLDLQAIAGRSVASAWRHLRPTRAAGVDIAILFTDDAAIAELNAAWRGKSGPTDVLSFPAMEPGEPWPDAGPVLLGDIVLALETCRRDASALDRSLGDHMAHLIVHGLLHLFHYDHQSADAAAEMEALEVAILADLGLPDPYGGSMLLEETR